MESVFKIEGLVASASAYAAGPWNPSNQHGGAVASLVTWYAEGCQSQVPMRIARVSIELCRPAPIGVFDVKTGIVREGGKIQICDVDLSANGVLFAKARILKVRTHELNLPDVRRSDALDLPLPEDCDAPSESSEGRAAFLSGLAMRVARGKLWSLGPTSIWFRADRPIVDQQPISQAMRAVIAADFSNGLSSLLPFHEWTFLNADLTVNLARLPVGEWILVSAETWLGPDGCGLASARLADVTGYFGRASQSLVIERRTAPVRDSR